MPIQHRKRFGQHFLQDKEIIQHIVDVIAPQSGQALVEIGPGIGAITFPILKKIGKLDAIELDRDLIPILQEKSIPFGELIIHEADALYFDFATLLQDKKPLRIFGNLPYNISTPLVFHLLEYANNISDMHFMLQKEVVDRMAAKAGDEEYGRLSVMVQYYCEVTTLFDVPRTAFNPPPQVTSSIVRMIPYKKLPYVANNYARFADLVRQAFSQRRKTLRNSLKNFINDDMWAHIALHSNLRPEELTVKDYVELSNLL